MRAVKKNMLRKGQTKHTSLGEIISSISFGGLGIFWLLTAYEYYLDYQMYKFAGLFICGLACLAGAFRYKLQGIVFKLFKNG